MILREPKIVYGELQGGANGGNVLELQWNLEMEVTFWRSAPIGGNLFRELRRVQFDVFGEPQQGFWGC